MSIEIPDVRRAASCQPAARRLLDLGLASILLVLLAVPMVCIALAIRLDSSGAALFRQQRLGQGRRSFVMYKFRTMVAGCDDSDHRELIARELAGEDTTEDGSCKLADDQRITRMGRWLRATSFDEVPQLFNVLLGQMSLVGPRPCLDWEAEMFPAEFAERFTVRPGITGLWQVSGRSRLGTLEMLRFDVTYVRTRSFWGDVAILLRTIPSLLPRGGAR